MYMKSRLVSKAFGLANYPSCCVCVCGLNACVCVYLICVFLYGYKCIQCVCASCVWMVQAGTCHGIHVGDRGQSQVSVFTFHLVWDNRLPVAMLPWLACELHLLCHLCLLFPGRNTRITECKHWNHRMPPTCDTYLTFMCSLKIWTQVLIPWTCTHSAISLE